MRLSSRSVSDPGPDLSFSPMAKLAPRLSAEEIRSVVALAWDDRPPFAAVMTRHGISPGQVVALMRRELTPNAFKLWSARGRAKPAAKAPVSRPRGGKR